MKKKTTYGLDAPLALKSFILASLLSLGIASISGYFVEARYLRIAISSLGLLITLIGMYLALSLVYGSRVLKFRERDWLIQNLNITGKEKVLDVGCGQGLLTIAIAQKLSQGDVVGIDIWSSSDQSNNSPKMTLSNAKAEGVSEKVHLVTAHAQEMPFGNAEFDLIVSSWALHNISFKAERRKALHEIDRLLKERGQVAIMDIYHTKEYTNYFIEKKYRNVHRLGPRYTFGNPTYLVLAEKINDTV